MNYSILDFATQLKNAALANRRIVNTPYAKIKADIGKVLVETGFLENIKKVVKEDKTILTAEIKYADRKPTITGISFFSRPSLKKYGKKNNISKTQKGGTGICILSTNKGILTVDEAQKKGLGGELLFKIW